MGRDVRPQSGALPRRLEDSPNRPKQPAASIQKDDGAGPKFPTETNLSSPLSPSPPAWQPFPIDALPEGIGSYVVESRESDRM